MLSFYFKKTILLLFFILLANSYGYAGSQEEIVDTPKPGTVMFLNQGYNNFKQGQTVVFLKDQGNGKYLTSLGLVNSSLLETKAEKEQQQQNETVAADHSKQDSDEYKLVLNNSEGCIIKFAPPHEQLKYVDNISLKSGEYDVSVSKRLYFPISLHIPMYEDVTYSVELESIFTNYGGGYIDKLIKNGEIKLDEEFEGKTLLHQLVDNFSKEYPSFSNIGIYEGLPEDAPIDDLLNSIGYFIDKGFDINKPDSTGRNLLSNIIQRGPAEVVAMLFQNGAKVQPEFINSSNDYAGLFPELGFTPGEKWYEKVLHLFPEELLTEILNREVDGVFPVTDHQFIKLLLEGGAYPFDAFARNDKQIQSKLSGNIVLVQGEEESYSYLKWATENYEKIKQWKEKQQITFKLNYGDFSEIKAYTSHHPDSLQYITDEKFKVFLAGPKGLTVMEIADRIAQGAKEDELIGLIGGNEGEYAAAFTSEQKQYMLDAGLTPKLIGFLEEHTQQVKIIKERRAMVAMQKQKQEDERKSAIRAANAERQAQIEARRRQEESSNHDLFGKIAAIGMGAVIANSSSLSSAEKTDFLTNYSQDVLNDDMSMKNTKQWKDKTVQQNQQRSSAINHTHNQQTTAISAASELVNTNSTGINNNTNNTGIRNKLAGEWAGAGGKIILRDNGSGSLDSAMCHSEIEWSSSSSELRIHYTSAVDCSYDDAQIGEVQQTSKKKPDEVVRYKLSKSDEMGFESMKLTLYSRTAPDGSSYFRPLTQAERGTGGGAGLSKQICAKEIADQTRECDAKGGTEMEIIQCKNIVMMTHIDCM